MSCLFTNISAVLAITDGGQSNHTAHELQHSCRKFGETARFEQSSGCRDRWGAGVLTDKLIVLYHLHLR
ncbi:hypothetical protein E2C01_011058 [Portunus trituberculatus]|uniref:Uncharacterized protein n=1 Tax=Portunus trituberculatus TaxID=210409 RepID=A0A5B7DA93_PORTR|nr:hypothetical protein [Portunus trituberculatus]